MIFSGKTTLFIYGFIQIYLKHLEYFLLQQLSRAETADIYGMPKINYICHNTSEMHNT